MQSNSRPYCTQCPCVLFSLSDPNAVIPSKGTVDSVGYDLTAIAVEKKLTARTTLYTTGLKILPPEGYYIEIVPRSSMAKTGYVLSNSIGTIDPDYTGDLLIALTKVDDSMPDLELPFTRCQMVMRKFEAYNMCEVEDVTASAALSTRGDGGFGSTDCS